MKTYMIEDDRKIIESVLKGDGDACSFREAGNDTIECLLRGAGAKHHGILDKTIKVGKNSQITAVVNNFFKEFEKVENCEKNKNKKTAKMILMGLVGYWKGKGSDMKISGIYVTQVGAKILPEVMGDLQCLGVSEKGQAPYLKLETEEQKQKLLEYYYLLENEYLPYKADYLFYRMFFTGDYDMHDFISSGVQVTTKIDEGIIKKLQNALYESRKLQLLKKMALESGISYTDNKLLEMESNICSEMKDEKPSDYYRIQHGPQYNYIVQMIEDNEKLLKEMKAVKQDTNKVKELKKKFNTVVDSVANPEFPILMYGTLKKSEGKKWGLINSLEELKEVYTNYGANIKVTWAESAEIRKHKVQILRQAFVFCLECSGQNKMNYVVNQSDRKKEKVIESMKTLLNELDVEDDKKISDAYGGEDEYGECLYEAYYTYFESENQKPRE